MEKLVLQEIWYDFSVALKKPYNYIVTIALVLVGTVFLGAVSTERNIYIIITFIILSNFELKRDISDCIYIIPIDVGEYIKAKYRIIIIIELLLYAAIEAVRCIEYIISYERLSYAFVLKQIFITAALILYVLIKNTWLLYVNFGLKEIQTYKIAQGLSMVWFFSIEIIAGVDIAGDKIRNTLPLMIELISIGGFIAYGIYICLYVKKNLIIQTFK